ncbi:hypothetical protein Lal_00024014 [Lupinus albus]|nr:hypothetical protein Lal_00024014 [Lupinus albus]
MELKKLNFLNPALSFENALSSGAKRVNPPEPDVTSCELSWLMSCVVLRRRIMTENFLAFVRILIMSMVGDLGIMVAVGAELGVTGTRGFVLNPGVGAVVTAGGDDNVGCGCGGDGGDDSGEAGGDVVGG